ncbi:MAG: HAMP domain-containing protein [Xanthomonadaceae bacterium]|nr:HAMP domain-containing protein [Xanthomonadaceae bacterium]
MGTSFLKRLLTYLLPAAGLALLLASLYLLSETTQASEDFGRLHPWLLLLNLAGVLALLVVIAGNLYRLVVQYRNHVTGSRLTARLVAIFVLLALAPVSLVYYFSLQFLNHGIDTWFDVRVEEALDDSLTLSRTSLDLRVAVARSRMDRVAEALRGVDNLVMPLYLHQARVEAGATELTVFGPNRIIATSSALGTSVLPGRPPAELLLQLAQGQPYVGLDPIADEGLHVRVILPLAMLPGETEPRLLQGLFSVPQRVSGLAANVQTAYTRYRELLFLREPLKYTFTLTLSLILLISLLAAVWAAFYAARKLVAPIQDLAAGTRAVAKGDYQTLLPMPARDEMGFLVLSFNEMTRRLARASEQARISQQEVERERAHLETLLSRLSSGVIAFDGDMTLSTANEAAEQILGVKLSHYIGRHLDRVAQDKPMLDQFMRACRAHFDVGDDEWREEVTIQSGSRRRVLMCSCATLPDEGGRPPGRVLVFEDMTVLLQAQREAAWGEVARRLAHEIKNPLTPIQLAAERVRHRYLSQMDHEEGEVLERCTRTIVQQVDALKEMVNAFSDYARAPDLQLAKLNLNELVREVVDLYRSGVEVNLALDDSMPSIEADSVRLRQLLHNLLKNAVEAVSAEPEGLVIVATRHLSDRVPPAVELEVCDNGPGFQQEVLEHAFEPYVTTKTRGTGLGLAIVRKLVEEHGGTLEAANRASGGARVSIRLPVSVKAPIGVLPATTEATLSARRRDIV